MSDLRYSLYFVILWVVALFSHSSTDDRLGKTRSSSGSPLSISGDVKQVRIRKAQAAGQIDIDVLATLHFENRTSRPLLIFVGKDWPWQGGQTLAASRDDALSHRYLYSSGIWPSLNKPAWEDTRSKLDQKSPPADLVQMIMPGAEWSFDKTVLLSIQVKGSFEKTSKPWDEIKKIDPLWLQLSFRLWPNSLEQDMFGHKFGSHLQERWKDQGQLVIDDFVSEPIPLHLPPG
jgi:hypothetical protein